MEISVKEKEDKCKLNLLILYIIKKIFILINLKYNLYLKIIAILILHIIIWIYFENMKVLLKIMMKLNMEMKINNFGTSGVTIM